MPEYCCPNCEADDGLWEDVELNGWRSIDSNLEVVVRGTYDRDVEWGNARRGTLVGCSRCSWEGHRDSLKVKVPLGVDGEPLPEIHPDQQTLEAA